MSEEPDEEFWNTFTLRVKQQFLNYLIFLINNFEQFYLKVEESKVFSAHDIFDFDKYLANVNDPGGFISRFLKTQAFISFIE